MKFYFLFLSLFFNLKAYSAISLVQNKHFDLDSGVTTTVAVTLNSAITAGNLIVVWVTWGTDSVAPTSVQDDELNTYTLAPSTSINNSTYNQSTALYYKENVTCSGGCGAATITVTWGGAKQYRALQVMEFSGVATSGALDKSNGQHQASTTTPSSPSVTTTTNGQLILGTTMDISNSNVTATVSDTVIVNKGLVDGSVFQYKIQSTAGSVSSSFTFSPARDAITSIATFKDAAAPTPIKHRVISD